MSIFIIAEIGINHNGDIKIAKELNHKEDLMNAHLLLSEVYYNLNDYSKSLTNKNIYQSIKDSIFNQNSANTLAYFQTLYETEKKERELIRDYKQIITDIGTKINKSNYETAVKIASIPDQIRGFGHVKEKNIKEAINYRTDLLNSFHENT